MKNYKTLGVLMAASVALITSAHAQYNWTGATSSNPTDSSNYSTSAPTYGATNVGNLYIANGPSGNPLDYATAEGTTVFTGNIRVGVSSGNLGAGPAELDVTGGNLTINSSGTSTVGYHGGSGSGVGTIGVSGGTLSINGTDQFWFGSTDAATANVSGGTFNVGDSFLISRQGGTAIINLSGNGVFDVTGANGTQYNANGGNGTATINLNGNGIFEQTGSGAINLGGKFTVNFGASSLGEFSLLGDSASTLDGYISAGDIFVNGTADTTLSDYQVIGAANSSSQGIIELAAAPEPSTWAMLLGSVLVLLGVQRLSRNRTV